eukprot:11876414-Alexandrium_andersonii.AAC.1
MASGMGPQRNKGVVSVAKANVRNYPAQHSRPSGHDTLDIGHFRQPSVESVGERNTTKSQCGPRARMARARL